MLSRLTFIALLVLLHGCPQPTPVDVRVTPPPSGQGHYTNENGMRLTLFTPAGRISYGQTKTASIAEGGLSGFIFSANAGDQPVLTMRSPGSPAVSIAIYGPRAENGLWGEHLAVVNGTTPRQLENWRPSSNGEYFALLRVFGEANIDIELSLECAGCDAAECISDSACNLYCPGGLVHDGDTGCLGCACRGSTCPSTGCRNGDVCVFPCGRGTCENGQTCVDGRCEDGQEMCGDSACEIGRACVDGECVAAAFECTDPVTTCERRCPNEARPVCARGDERLQTFPNACVAECNGFMDVSNGRCEDECNDANPCPGGHQCVAGQCRPPECRCDGEPEIPVCGVSGRTYRSECQARCADDAVAYPGRCRDNPCETHEDCRFDEACIPVGLGEVSRRFNCDPETDPECVRECRPLPRCSSDRPCPQRPAGLGCYPVTANEGICVPTCAVESEDISNCPLGQCAAVLHRRGRQISAEGICLPECERDDQCSGNLRCLPDLKGRRICQTCACGDFPQDRPVCTESGRFENLCQALCAGLGADASADRQVEICDEVDNDCDGRIDEGLGDVQEVCDGIDNNCNGRIDEGIGRQECGQNEGLCQSGFRICQRGEWSACMRMVSPADEICDEQDNDCDGRVDEDFEDAQEICDGQDNDCDGRVDEDFGDAQEICDGEDNDCDGRIDETNDPCPDGEPCPDRERGPLSQSCEAVEGNPRCGRGQQQCVGGRWGPCVSLQAPMVEVCDDLDNDCDGRIDEDPTANGAGPDGGLCEGPPPQDDCADCPVTWAPVCADSGVIYANACEAACRPENVALVRLEDCYDQDMPLPMRCVDDDDCLEFGRGGQLCLNADARADAFRNVGSQLSRRAECLANTGQCRCNAGQCGFRPTQQTRRCFQVEMGAGID